jgi:hypothetical protein
MPHVPVHVAVALATAVEHAVPHAPQLLRLLVVSTHTPLHSVGVGAEHPETHVEPEQTGVLPLHRLPQVPQLVALLATQRPLHRMASPLQLLASLPPSSPPDSLVEPSSSKAASSSASVPVTVASSSDASSPESEAYELDESDVTSSSPPTDPEELPPELPGVGLNPSGDPPEAQEIAIAVHASTASDGPAIRRTALQQSKGIGSPLHEPSRSTASDAW